MGFGVSDDRYLREGHDDEPREDDGRGAIGILVSQTLTQRDSVTLTENYLRIP